MEITNDMLDSFSKMIKSADQNDCTLALDILNNRDKTNLQSEENYNKLKTMIISNEKFFPREGKEAVRWVVKIDGKVLSLGNYSRNVFETKKKAEAALSRHLTRYLGQNPMTISLHTDYRIDEKIYKRGHTDAECANYYGNNWNRYIKRNVGEEYDPNFDKKKYIKELKLQKLKENHGLNYSTIKDPYFRGLKQLFKGGKELRDFLVENKLVTFEQLK